MYKTGPLASCDWLLKASIQHGLGMFEDTRMVHCEYMTLAKTKLCFARS